MKSKQVIIELQFSRLDLIVVSGGRIVRSRRFEIALDNDPQAWIEAVNRLGETLASTVEKFDLRGSPVVVLYSSPTQVVELAGFSVRSSSVAAEAAQLRCLESLPFSSLSAVCRTVCVGRDSRGDDRRVHTVAAADREDVLLALTEMVEAAGLRFEHALPTTAAVLRMLAMRTLADKSGCRGRLYIGERHSLLTIADRGAIVFSRLINIGLDAIARSLTRPIERDGDTPALELNLKQARELLYTVGIPSLDRDIEDAHGLTSRQILPPMQPVLQRFIVELRQSIRFGLNEQQREAMELQVSGPGSVLEGVVEYLKTELGQKASLEFDRRQIEFDRPAARGSELADAIDQIRFLGDLRLQPARQVYAGRTSRLRQWLWAGAAAAVVMVAIDGIGYKIRLDGAQLHMRTISGLSEQYERLEENGRHLRDALIALNGLQNSVAAEVGVGVEPAAIMDELARIAPASIRFTKISIRVGANEATAMLSGFSFTDRGVEEGEDIESFMQRLRLSPLFASVKLVTVQAGVYDDQDGQRFDATGRLVLCPREDLWSHQLADAQGDLP